jgi:hypothetical protein
MSLTARHDAEIKPSVTADSLAASDEHMAELRGYAAQLLGNVRQITLEEFHWQELHYDHDSRRGRELLFLMANYEWVRATSETIDISRADAVETTIKVDIDLDRIAHEVFRHKDGAFWLPITILPPQALDRRDVLEQHRLELDPFATVMDAAGELLPMLPTADVRHQMSAAMAEIIVNMAVARWPGPSRERPTATRDQRLLLSAAVYRLLRRGPVLIKDIDGPNAGKSRESPPSRIDNARGKLLRLLNAYNQMLRVPITRNVAEEPNNFATPDAPQFASEPTLREITTRALKVLSALAESMVVVIPVKRDSAPTVMTVQIPARSLNSSVVWRPTRASTWMLRPLGHLEIDLLMPTADADRQVQVHLPDGMSFEEAHDAESKGVERPRMDIEVRRPQPLEDLAALMRQILDPLHREWPLSLRQCLTDMAKSKMGAARETLRQYDVIPAGNQPGYSASSRRDATAMARDTLKDLREALDKPYASDEAALGELEDVSRKFEKETLLLFRRTSADRPSPRTVVARTDMIEDVYQRATPSSAKVHVDVVVTDAEYFSIARSSGRMSFLVMSVVLAFLVASRLVEHNEAPSPEVLAIVLTLFSAIQAGQMESPDRSTLRGLLVAAGNWLIAASILPAVILAIGLAFPHGGWEPTIWAGICIGLQLLFQLAMWRGPLTAAGSSRPGQRRIFFTAPLDYRPFEALRSDYWRSTTADALMIGRTASAYVAWQKAAPPQLKPLLDWINDSTVPGEPVNVLAFLWSGTFRQASTFVIFSAEPGDDWRQRADIVEKLDLDPDRLAPLESVTNIVDIFLGLNQTEMPHVGSHPLISMLSAAAAHKLVVMEAQLPVPNPVTGYNNRKWSRVRVGLRGNEDVRRLASFLSAIRDRAVTAQNSHDCVVAVRSAPTDGPRVITDHAVGPTRRLSKAQPVFASDLDVITSTLYRDALKRTSVWRTTIICADGRSNIENDIVQAIAEVRPKLQLAGLTYALLHGTAVLVMLTREQRGDALTDKAQLEFDLRELPALSNLKLQVLVNEELSQSELEPAGKFPLLRVHFRWRDRPGELLAILEAISKALNDQRPPIGPGEWSISYARTQAAVGRTALARLTIRVHTDPRNVKSWDFDDIERKVRTLAALQTPVAQHTGTIPEDPVVSVGLVTMPPGTPHDEAPA